MTNKILIIGLAIISVGATLFSCKDLQPAKGRIHVIIDSSGAAAPNTSIRITSLGTNGNVGKKSNLEGINKVITTNASGDGEIEVKLDAVVQCYATKATGKAAPRDTLRGVKSLQLTRDKKNAIDTVTIRLRY
jgi:hypothetical protein